MKARDRITKRKVRRKFRVRNQLKKSGRLRLTVFRSNCHIYAQVIDDVAGNTLLQANSLESSIAGIGKYAGNISSATKVGELLASRAKEKGIEEVTFDRGAYRFHGRVKALAEAVRAGGIKF